MITITDTKETRQLEDSSWKAAIYFSDEDAAHFLAMKKQSKESGRKIIIELEKVEGLARVQSPIDVTLANILMGLECMKTDIEEARQGLSIKQTTTYSLPDPDIAIPEPPMTDAEITEECFRRR